MTPDEFLVLALEFDGGNPPELWGYLVEEDDDIEPNRHLSISARISAGGTKRWVIVILERQLLTKRGDLVYEPLPSSRTETLIKRTRFDTYQEAFIAMNTWKEKRRKQLRKAGTKTYKEYLASLPPELKSVFS